MDNVFGHTNYTVRKQVFKLFGGSFRIYDPTDNLVLFASMKAFKLKEDIRLYTGEDKREELLLIKARNIIDFSSAYDVVDSATGQKIGALKRKGWKSMVKDEWIIMDELDNEVGIIQEDQWILAILRRIENLGAFVPQKFSGDIKGMPVLHFTQNFNPFALKLNLDFSIDTSNQLDRRLGLAAAILLCAVEGRQS